MRRLRARGHDLADGAVEGDAPDGVHLLEDHVRQASGSGASVVVLVQRSVAVVHRLGDIDDQMAAEVGLGLVLLDVEAVGLGPDLPVEVANVVANAVLAVLHELDGVPEHRALVHAGDEPLDDLASAKIEAGDLRDRRRVQKAQRAGVQGNRVAEAVRATVLRVADDGVAARGELHAELVLAACLRAEFE